MQEDATICLEFRSADAEVASGYGYFQLPFQIGRTGARSRHFLALGARHEKISRVHAELTGAGEGNGIITITDRSRNGTLVRGSRLFDGQALNLAHGETFQIPPFTFSLRRSSEAAHFLRWHEDDGPHTCPIFPGYSVTLGRDPESSTLVISGFDPTTSAKHAEISVDGTGSFLIRNRSEINKIYLNNRRELNPGSEIPCVAGDVFSVGNRRFQLFAGDRAALECSNPKCRLLNLGAPESECRWCGWHLADATRVHLSQR